MRVVIIPISLALVGACILIRWPSPIGANPGSHIVSQRFTDAGDKTPLSAKRPYKAVAFTVHCPAGQHVTGGGYRASETTRPGPSDELAVSSYPSSDMAWTVRAFNGDAKGHPFVVYAVCA